MSFLRVKIVKGKKYAYLVRNVWDKKIQKHKQIIIEYRGRVADDFVVEKKGRQKERIKIEQLPEDNETLLLYLKKARDEAEAKYKKGRKIIDEDLMEKAVNNNKKVKKIMEKLFETGRMWEIVGR